MTHFYPSLLRVLRFTPVILLVGMAPLSSSGQIGLKKDQPAAKPENEIVVKIQANKNVFVPGESVHLHVEIWNEGPKDIFVSKNFSLYDGSLEILLHYGTKVDGPTERGSADYWPRDPNDTNKPPLAIELSKYWMALPPGHFYGGEVVLDSRSYERLRIPGRYRIEGQYYSGGFFVRDDFGNPLADYVEELKRLPYQAWEGKVNTNPVWIEVKGGKKI